MSSTPDLAGFPRLVRLEVEKQATARSSRWLVLGTGSVVLAIYLVGLLTGGAGGSVSDALVIGSVPIGVIVPVIAILSIAGEWSTRSVQFTYLLQPRRLRVLVAQVVGVLALAMTLWAVAVIGAGAVALLAGGDLSPTAGRSLTWSLLGPALLLLVNTLAGAAFASLLQNTPSAIVAFLALPTAGVVFLSLMLDDHPVVQWLSLNSATTPLAESRALSLSEWGQLGTAVALWVGLPLALGAARLTRRDVS